MKSEKKIIGASLLTAIAASACCITPVLSLVAGTTGLASNLSWIEPVRPYLICATILTLGFAWYQKIFSNKKIDCGCENEGPSFTRSKGLLAITTITAILLLAFPYYSKHLFSVEIGGEISPYSSNEKTVEFKIAGMTCQACENHIIREVNKIPGIKKVTSSFDYGNAIIIYDSTRTTDDDIKKAIKSTGYLVLEIKN